MPHGVGTIPGQGLRDLTTLFNGFALLSTFQQVAPHMRDGLRVARPDETNPRSTARLEPPDGIGRMAQGSSPAPQLGRNLDILA